MAVQLDFETSIQIEDAAAVKAFILGGNAYFTLRSKPTGKRYTYRVRKHREEPLYFVSRLYGPNNEQDYVAFATMRDDKVTLNKKRAAVEKYNPPSAAFVWFWRQLTEKQRIHPETEFWHEGRCCVCARKLTVPESIAAGIGPECSSKNL